MHNIINLKKERNIVNKRFLREICCGFRDDYTCVAGLERVKEEGGMQAYISVFKKMMIISCVYIDEVMNSYFKIMNKSYFFQLRNYETVSCTATANVLVCTCSCVNSSNVTFGYTQHFSRSQNISRM